MIMTFERHGPKLAGIVFADIKLTQFEPVTVTIKAGEF
jgi:hypothetical protein